LSVYDRCMDALASLLDGPRARGAFTRRVLLDPPWCIRVQDQAPLSVVCMARGDAWVLPVDGGPRRLFGGGVAIMRGRDPYDFADDPTTEPQVIIHPGGHCATLDGVPLAEPMSLGVRSWGTNRAASTVMLVGTYQVGGEISQRLLDALPPVVTLCAEDSSPAVVALLGEEISRNEPGQGAVLDRLLDLVLTAALRAWFARPEAGAPAWYRAHGDPVVGAALNLMHNNPAHPWTVAGLATKIGVSRAALAKRFTALVGEPPMSYLTGWRLDLAADLLREPNATVGSVARRVGYGSAFALSTAFKRVHGISPREHRAASPDRAD
jgi:AraC-like DNA-binding protein